MLGPRCGRRRWLLIAAVAAPVIGLAGVVVAEVVPDGRIASHVNAGYQRGELTAANGTVSLLGTTADHYAECVAVMIGLGDPPGNIVRRALYSASSYGCVETVEKLEEFAASGQLSPSPDYMRYWHGYAVITRPALAIVGLAGTRWLAFGLLGLAIGVCARGVLRRFGVVPTMLLLAPGLLTTDMIVGGWSIAQALGLATAWVGGWIVLSQASTDNSWQVVATAAALGGAVSAYFDLMVAIPASLALCTVAAGWAAVATSTTGRADAPMVRSMAVAAGGWAVGLGAMWASKWVLAWLFVDRDRVVDSVRDQISFRTGGEYEGVSGSRLTGLKENIAYWMDQPLTPVIVVVTVGAVAAVAWSNRARLGWTDAAWLAACVAVAVVPVAAWYVVLDNHNQIHFWLTYRSVAITFGAVGSLAAAVLGTSGDERRPRRYAPVDGDDELALVEPAQEQDVTPQAITL